MAKISNPATTYTLTDFINEKSNDELTYANFSIIKKMSYGYLVTDNVVNSFIDELKKVCSEIKLENITVEQKARYKYHPDLLAYDIYGSTQLDFIVLLCNGIIDPKEFDFETTSIKLPTSTILQQFLSQVNSGERVWLSKSQA